MGNTWTNKGVQNANQFTLISGEDQTANLIVVEQRYSYVNITTQTTTVVKGSPGFLQAIIINTPVASSVITIYDNTAGSGTKIGTITLPATLLSDGSISITYNATCTTGLTVVTASGTSDVTVIYR